MRVMRGALGFLFALALVGLGMTFVVESSYTNRAVKVQLVRTDPNEHSRFGPVLKDVGLPIMLIVGDPRLVLTKRTASGLPTVDADYLQRNPEAGIKLDPLRSIIGLARIGSLFASIITGLGVFLLPKVNGLAFPTQP